MSLRPILVLAGGTGGHVYPALAVAQALQLEAREIVWLGTHAGLESRVVPAAGIAMEWISVKGLRRKGVIALILAPFRLLLALMQSLRVIWKYRPAAVLGMGGFVSGPGGLAAWLLRRPLVIHEQQIVFWRVLPGLCCRPSRAVFPLASKPKQWEIRCAPTLPASMSR